VSVGLSRSVVNTNGATKEGVAIEANSLIGGRGVEELDEAASLEDALLLDPADLLDFTASAEELGHLLIIDVKGKVSNKDGAAVVRLGSGATGVLGSERAGGLLAFVVSAILAITETAATRGSSVGLARA